MPKTRPCRRGVGGFNDRFRLAVTTGYHGMSVIALYRPERSVRDWIPVEIIERRANGDAVCRELDKFWPGVWIARSWQVATGDDA